MENILVVDDEVEIWKICERTLSRKDYIIHTANNADEAADLLNDVVFDLALVDLRMPGRIDGMELIRVIKENNPNTQVIVVTAEESIQTAMDALSNGAFDYILKPFNLQELLESVERVMRHGAGRNKNTIFRETNYLYQVFQKLENSKSKNENLLEFIIRRAVKALKADAGSIHLYIPQRNTLKIMAFCGSELDRESEVKLGERIVGWVAENKKPLLFNNQLSEYPQFNDLTIRDYIASSMIVPLVKHNTLLGVICLNRFTEKTNLKFTPSDLEALQLFALHCSLIIALEHYNLIPRFN
ncbi:MAG: hypothetical protein A2219_01395 [Elusimicrobia bacterium RIFOXYA2_FULL_50_26]|nr:MAG: hypothetical protein A2219_01395 [Elusimicrobia bacterium RIFOXYA2_FULL_50_26]OGS24200.1 MAG: hypothetical protein A2314_00985 [Elusimicrobia bacterium RIFOXYB2_FULL_50_12]